MANGEFKIASAFVEVNLKDNTQADEAAIRSRLESRGAVEMGLKATADKASAVKAGQALVHSARAAAARMNGVKIRAVADDPTAVTAGSTLHRLAQGVADEEPVKVRSEADKAEAAKAGTVVGETAAKSALKQGRLGGSLLASAIAAGVALGAPAIGAALTVGVGAAFIGLAALAQHNNQQIVQSFTSLKDDVVTSTQEMTASMTGELAGAGDSLRLTFNELRPEISQVFTGVLPDIGLLTDGIGQLAGNAMPGLVDAARTSQAAMGGFADFLGQTGDAVSGLFTTMSQHAGDFGNDWQVLGSVVQSTVDLTGNLIGQLATIMSQHGAQIEHTFETIDHTVTNLASGALPALGNGVFGTLGMLSSLLDTLQPIMPALGNLAGQALTAYAGFRLLRSAGNGLSNLGGRITKFSDESTARLGRLGRGITKVGKAIGGAAPIIGMVLPLALNAITEDSRRAADEQANLAQNTATLQQAMAQLGTTTGSEVLPALTQLTSAQSTTIDGGKTLAANAKLAGIGLTSMGEAAMTSKGTMQALADKGLAQLTDKLHSGQISLGDWMSATKDLGPQLDNLRQSYANAAKLQAKLTAKQEEGTSTAAHLESPTRVLADDLQKLGSKAQTAATAAKVLDDAMKALTGGYQSAFDAQSSFYDTLDNLTHQMKNAKGSILDTNGALNAQSQKGRLVGGAIESARKSMEDYATSQLAAGHSAKDVTHDLEGMRGGLIKTLESFGLTEKQANSVADAMRAIPSQIVSAVNTPGMLKAQQAATILKGKVLDVPDGKTIHLKSITKSAEQKLTDLGFHVTHLKDGTVAITADDSKLMAALRKALGVVDTSKGKAKIDGDPGGFFGALGKALDTTRTSKSTAHIGGESSGFLSTLWGALTGSNTSHSTSHIWGEAGGFLNTLWGALTGSNTSHSTSHIWGEAGAFFGTLWGALTGSNTSHSTSHIWGEAGAFFGTLGGAVAAGNQASPEARLFLNDSSARGTLRGFRGAASTPISTPWFVHKIIQNAVGGILAPNADGNLFTPNATGNILKFAGGGFTGHELTPMRGGVAAMVPPATFRVIGDNMTVPEAYIPIDRDSARSQALLTEANRLMGRGGGTTVINHNETFPVYVRDNATAYEVTRMTSAEVGFRLRARR